MKPVLALLKALAICKIVLVAFFFASFHPASVSYAEAETASCGGDNLITRLERENPETMAEVRAEAAHVLNGKGIFWRVDKEGVPPSWILGTMHVSDPMVTDTIRTAKAAMDRSTSIIVENADALDPNAAASAMASLQHLTILQNGESLATMLSDRELKVLEERLQPRGMPIQLATRLQPWLIGTMLSIPACEMAAKQAGRKVLDGLIAQYALDNSKTLESLETIEEQFSAIAGLPMEYHLNSLQETLSKEAGFAEDVMATMKTLYRSGEVGMLFPLIKRFTPKALSGKGSAAFQQALIVERNQTMFDRAKQYLDAGSAFIAIGALHLPGEHGLINLLEESGYQLSRETGKSQG